MTTIRIMMLKKNEEVQDKEHDDGKGDKNDAVTIKFHIAILVLISMLFIVLCQLFHNLNAAKSAITYRL